MKKKILVLVTFLLCMTLLAGCQCKHDEWIEADCVTAKTCAECGETEGDPLGHNWLEASCDVARTCSRCGETDGRALGHIWTDATCEAPKTCSWCGATEGEALGHTWVDATCKTAKTCSVCAATEGEPLEHSLVIKEVVNSEKILLNCQNCDTVEVIEVDSDSLAAYWIQGKWVAEKGYNGSEEFELEGEDYENYLTLEFVDDFGYVLGPWTATWSYVRYDAEAGCYYLSMSESDSEGNCMVYFEDNIIYLAIDDENHIKYIREDSTTTE